MKKLISNFLVASVGGVMAIFVYTKINTPNLNAIEASQQPIAIKVNNNNNLPESTINFTQAAEQSVNGVVHIKTNYKRQNIYNDPFHNFFYGNPGGDGSIVQQGSGSGVVISADGYIATNNHVVEGADEIEVVLNNKKSYTAEVIGTDPSTDLALLKIKENNLSYLLYGNSDDVRVGEWVLAVGNPFNLTSTVTAGIVSAKGRNINLIGSDRNTKVFPIESFIQTDAAVNPGNSGGALVSATGQLVGINTAIASQNGQYAGYSFAVPVNIVKKVMNDLLEFGEVQRAFIGVSIRDIDSKLAEEKGLTQLKGVYVSGLTDGGSAEEAGVKEGDIITKVGNAVVNTPAELQEQVGSHRPGDKVVLTVLREGKEKLVNVLLKNKNGTTNIVKKSKAETATALGASFEEISVEDKQTLGVDYGLRVLKLNSGKLKSAGIKEGFIITSIDKKPIKTMEDITNALGAKKGGVLIEGVYPNGLRAYYGFGM